ncbi:thiamine-phosphate kinase [Sphingomonas sp. MMS24-J13]|uniref:thiamine-phosphate kinase n=1 Tax=Sphingomonas sp. MMS24-J13 TaxID=3238686 RepID=UPI00384D0BAB
MSREGDFIARLAAFATHPAARGLKDDAAVLSLGDRDIVLTHDMIVEGIHYLPGDPPQDVAWKLVAVNLSDLAAKGAKPLGVLLGFPLGDAVWDAAFAEGLKAVLMAFEVPLLGGDTVSGAGPRHLGLTAIGETKPGQAPARCGAKAGDTLYVTGRIGAAGLGLAVARGERPDAEGWLAAYRRPTPRLAEGQALAPSVHAMADISDGLLIDAQRMAQASGIGIAIDLDTVPVVGTPMAAVTAGDDYELLFAGPAGLTLPPGLAPVTAIGRGIVGSGLTLFDRGIPIGLPSALGYEHNND